MFFNDLLAAAPDASAEPNTLMGFVPLIVIFVIFYFLVIRPQHKKVKQHNEMLDKVARGDTVVSNGGIVGKVSTVNDDNLKTITMEIAPGVEIKLKKSYVAEVVTKD